MTDRRTVPFRLLWLTLPFTLGPLVAGAVEDRSDPTRLVVLGGCWAVWGLALLAALVPRATTLTAVRIAAPATAPVAAWSAVVDGVGTAAAIGAAAAVAATLAALSAPLGDAFVDGSSYGDERRFPLRPPGVLLTGPLVVVWAATVAGVAAGPLLLAVRQWVAGAVVLAVGPVVAVAGWRSLHQLSRRWLVFVPAGFVLHDPLATVEPVLFRRSTVARLGLAPADTTATDLTVGALGPALQADLVAPVAVALRRWRQQGETTELTSFLVMPTRPGRVLAEAARRRIPVG